MPLPATPLEACQESNSGVTNEGVLAAKAYAIQEVEVSTKRKLKGYPRGGNPALLVALSECSALGHRPRKWADGLYLLSRRTFARGYCHTHATPFRAVALIDLTLGGRDRDA